MSLDPREVARQKFEQILGEKREADEKANHIVWAAVAINAGLGLLPVGINIWTFIGVSTVMIIWLGRVYDQTLTNESAGKLIRHIFQSVGVMFFMTILGLKFGAEVLKVSGVFAAGGPTVAGMALDGVLMGAITYALGFTSKEMFKRSKKMSSEEIRSYFKKSFEEGKQKVKQRKETDKCEVAQ